MPQELLRFYLLCGGIALCLTLWFGLRGDRGMVRRSVTILVLLHALVAVLWLGETGTVTFAALLCGLGTYEVLRHVFGRPISLVMALLAMAMAIGIYWLQLLFWLPLWLTVVMLTFLAPTVIIARSAWALVFGLVAVPMGCVALMKLAQPVPVLWMCLIILVQFNDTLALLVGKRFGRHKLVPGLSPNKSLEGFAGGALGTILAMVTCWLLFPDNGFSNMLQTAPSTALAVTAAALLAWLTASLGDLLFSKYKRAQGIKDFSALLPGHGGLVDRFDSLLVLAPVAWGALFLFHPAAL